MQQFLISALCLCLCLAATSAAASGRDLRVGLSDEYPPLSYIDEDGQRRGFEYELADSLCRRLGRTCVWTFTTQADLVQGLRNGSFDLIFAQRLEAINVAALNKFEDGATVDAQALLEKGILSKCRYGVKILGNGAITKKLTVQASAFSASAKEKIEAAGGKAEVI